MRIIQVVGYKNAGKTTLVCELVRAFAAEGYKVGTAKRDAHEADPEPPGKDTWKHRQAGAGLTAFVSASRTAWVEERETPIEELADAMRARGIEVLLVEGFKAAPYPKIALLRDERDADLLELANVIAVACRAPMPAIEREAALRGIPVFALPDTDSFGPLASLLLSPTMLDETD